MTSPQKMLLAHFLASAVTVAAFAETVTIKGSNTFGEELGPRLFEHFKSTQAKVEFALESKGSASGFDALLNGECDIAASSRPANEGELRLAKSRGINMKLYSVGYYGVGVLVHKDNPVSGLTDSQVADIFTGRIRNWKEVGGADHPISVYIRDPVSGTHLGFQEVAMGYVPYLKEAKTFTSYRAIAEALHNDIHGIGYSGVQSLEDLKVRTLFINGFPANDVAINEGLYPYARLVRFYTNAQKESDAAREFIRFLQSKNGREVLAQMGYVPKLRPMFGAFPDMAW